MYKTGVEKTKLQPNLDIAVSEIPSPRPNATTILVSHAATNTE